MNTKLFTLAAVLALANSVEALELSAGLSGADANGCRLVIVNPQYVPPTNPNPCIVLSIPSTATMLTWRATELWEMPATNRNSWTRLTCGATKYNSTWSYSCFNSGVLGQYEGHSMDGTFTGNATQLDATVRGWWAVQR